MQLETSGLKGVGFGRLVKCLAATRGDVMLAREYARTHATSGGLEQYRIIEATLKALVNPVSADEALVHARPLANSFLELVRPRSLVDRIVGLRQVPLNTSMLRVTGAAATYWVGEGAPKPLGRFSLDRATMGWAKLVSMIVVSDELVRASGQLADYAFSVELARGVASYLDKYFIDPSLGPTANVSPGSITHGITPIASSGVTPAAVISDLKQLFAQFVAADGAIEEAVLTMHPKTALALSLMQGPDGGLLFPKIGARGGEIGGVPVLTTSAAAAAGSPGETFIVMFDPGQILFSDDGDISMHYSHYGSVQMSDTPGSGAQQQVSLWQNNLVGIQAERFATWERATDSAVAVLGNVNY